MTDLKRCPGCGKAFRGKRKVCSYRCAKRAVRDCVKQLRNKKGPIYDKWKKNLEESLKRV